MSFGRFRWFVVRLGLIRIVLGIAWHPGILEMSSGAKKTVQNSISFGIRRPQRPAGLDLVTTRVAT